MARILIVDDDPSTREYLATLVGILGHSCVTAANGIDALDAALDHPLDLVITDLEMPRMDGLAFLQELRRHSALAQVPALVYTGSTDPGCELRALDNNAGPVLRKPVEARVLLSAIRAALRQAA